MIHGQGMGKNNTGAPYKTNSFQRLKRDYKKKRDKKQDKKKATRGKKHRKNTKESKGRFEKIQGEPKKTRSPPTERKREKKEGLFLYRFRKKK